MEQEWGSMFYKHIGNHTREKAKQICSAYGDSVHLPIPRFEDENEFYRNHFRNETLWFDISRTSYGIYDSPHGQLFAKPVNLWTHSGFQYVILTEEGEWQTTDELNQRDSICVFNIPPNDNCFKCYDKAFCRFTQQSRQETECVCPIDRKGEFCEILKLWTEWSCCSMACGSGVQTRSRKCETNCGDVPNNYLSETKECNDHNCSGELIYECVRKMKIIGVSIKKVQIKS